VASCGRVEQAPVQRSETALVIAVKGSADYYTSSGRARPAASRPVIDEAKWLERCANCSRSASADRAGRTRALSKLHRQELLYKRGANCRSGEGPTCYISNLRS